MSDKLYWKLYNNSLTVMEMLEMQDSFLKRLGYKYARKIYDNSFKQLFMYSPYDYRRNGDIEDE